MDFARIALLWKEFSVLIPQRIGRGRPPGHSFYDIFRAILWMLETGSQWGNLPRDFPPRSTVHEWYQKWIRQGLFQKFFEKTVYKLEVAGLIDNSETYIDATFIRSKGTRDTVGKTKIGKGSKIMAIVDRNDNPISIHVDSAQPHESKLVQETLKCCATQNLPERIIGDKAYDCDSLDRELALKAIKMISPHKKNRKKQKTQDGRSLRRYKRRWKVELFFARIQWLRKILIRYEKKVENFLGFVLLATTKNILCRKDYMKKVFSG